MKILIFYQYFGTPQGSWSTRVYELAIRWVNMGHQVEVVSAPYDKSDIRANGFVDVRMIDGIKLRVINSGDSNRFNFIKRVYRAILFSISCVYYALRLEYDVLIASSGPITIGIPMLFAKWFRRKPVVFEVRDLWPQGAVELGKVRNPLLISVGRRFERLCYKTSDLVVAASPGMEEGVKKSSPLSKTLVIPNASDLSVFGIPETIPVVFPESLKGKKIIVYAGSLGLMDECETAIMAMKDFQDSDLALVFLGDGSERSQLELLARKYAPNNIYFMGLIPKTEVAKWYSLASLSIVGFKNFPVLGTSSPNKMFDSFAAGVPVLQNTSGWIHELISTYQCGFNVRYGTLSDYQKVYSTVLHEPQLLEEYGKRALKLAETTFNRDHLAELYLKSLLEIERKS